MLCSTVVALSYAVAQASAACDRTNLQGIVAAYIQAHASGSSKNLPIANNFTYTENEVATDITRSILSQAITVDLSRSLFDTTECSTFTEITAATDKHPFVIDTNILVSNGSITAIQAVVADTGDWVFNATSHLSWSKSENWEAIPVSKRDKRSTIKAAGDAYLDSWADGKIKVPYGTPCARLEGGAYTGSKNTTSNTCHMPEFPKPFEGALNRRYVIDEEIGAVGILHNFPFIDATRPEGTPSTNLLRIEGGEIRYIHETTICATKNCGR